MKIRNKHGREETSLPRYLYDDSEIADLDGFISDVIGQYANVFHEIASPDIHLDVCIVEPTDDEPYYKLVTMGAGAYPMSIPENWQKYQLNYAEYILYLPKDWNIDSKEERDYWPIRLLKNVARLPIWCDTWLSYGHTTQADEEGSPYSADVRFNSVVLNFAENQKGDVRLKLSSGKTVNFYEIIPLYPEELEYKIKHDADALFEKFAEKGIQYRVLDRNRRSIMDESDF